MRVARRTCTRGRVYVCSPAQPSGTPISKGYSPDRHDGGGGGATAVLVQRRDNRDKWPVIRRSLKREHSYELPGNEKRRRSISNRARPRGSVSLSLYYALSTSVSPGAGGTQRGPR